MPVPTNELIGNGPYFYYFDNQQTVVKKTFNGVKFFRFPDDVLGLMIGLRIRVDMIDIKITLKRRFER